jgi:hypothetical protein
MLISLGAIVLLAACQTISYEGNEASPYYPIPAGSQLTLNQELTIPADQVAVFLQDGRAVASAQVSHYGPFCKFELYTLRDTARKVPPDEFTITKTAQERTLSGGGGPLLYGKLSVSLVASGDVMDSGPSIQIYATRMDLRSAKQPDVFRLTCSQWGYPENQHVTIAEVRRALGDLFTLHVVKRGG